MIASLPMYVWPELSDAHDRYWDLIRAELEAAGIRAPERLSQHLDESAAWTDPDLVLSQTCGMPYRNQLHDRVSLVGTPDFGVPGCEPGYYRSAIVVRADDTRDDVSEYRDAVLAFNGEGSQSGYAAIHHHVAPLGFWFAERLHTGSHAASVGAIAEGRADIASIDAVSWAMIVRYDDRAASLRILDLTEPTPGLPYIAARDADADATFAAVEAAIAGLDDTDRAALGIRGLVRISKRSYLAVPNPPQGRRP